MVSQSKDHQKLHQDAIVLDGHNDTLMHLVGSERVDSGDDPWLPVLDLNQELSGKTRHGHIDLPKLRKGGLNVPFFAAFATEKDYPGRTLNRHLSLINALYWNVGKNPENIGLATSVSQIRSLVDQDKIAAVLTMEGGDALKEPYGKELLHQFYDLGVRVLSLTWNNSNQLAEGLQGTFADGSKSSEGLTDFGKEIVREMDALGMILDVSHLHENSFWDVTEQAQGPIIASHSSTKGIYSHPRNLSDQQLNAVKNSGGVVHINFADKFLAADTQDASIEKIVDHLTYAAELIGVEHVGLGSDFDGASMPVDVPDASAYPEFTRALWQRGYSESEIQKILGENTLRVMNEVASKAHSKATAKGVNIKPTFEMGASFDRHSVELSADIILASEEPSQILQPGQIPTARAIINGQIHPARVIHENEHGSQHDTIAKMYAMPDSDNLQDGFNVITFQVTDVDGNAQRLSRIFHASPYES